MGDRVIIDCRNLMGDTIYLIKPLRQFLASERLEHVALGVNRGLPGEIVQRSFPHIRVEPMEVLEAAWPGVDRIVLSAMSAWEKTRDDNSHISQGYARILGIDLTDGIEPDVAWLPPLDPVLSREYVVLAPFSVSCARHRGEPPNKTINEPDWVPLLEIARGYGWPLRVIGGPMERFSMHELGFSETDYYAADTIGDLVSCLHGGWLVIGVDNGICHVSSCAGIPTIVLWSSAAAVKFIGETWAPRTRLVHIGTPTGLDTYRVAGLVAGAARRLLGWETKAAAHNPEAAVPADGRAGFPAVDPSEFIPLRYVARGPGNWSAHLPLARDLVASLRPRMLVDLGTNLGESYFGLCQSVAEAGCPCSCYAVDTWHEEPDSPASGEAVYERVRRHNSEHYGSFSYLLRKHFDDALEWFSEESIDLLNIGGRHAYEAVKRDFDAWYSKVAPGGIVLLPDVAARCADFSGWRLWEETSQAHRSLELHHFDGLSVMRKLGGRPARGGILDYLFLAEDADPIRRKDVSCGEPLDGGRDADAGMQPGRGTVVTDPPTDVVSALTDPGGTNHERWWIQLPLADSTLLRNDFRPVDRKPDAWYATTPDPWIVCSADLNGSDFRFFLLKMSCWCEGPRPHAQLFWSGPERPGFAERLSVRFPVIPDGQPHTYVVDLHAGADAAALNHLWWHRGIIDTVRLDPLDAPGEFSIVVAGFALQDWAESDFVRDALHLRTVRSELSYRYLRGSGVEIGAPQGPLELRPDAYIRYADRLTVADPSAQQPALDRFPHASPATLFDLASLAPISEGSVDFVIANRVLEHVPDPLAEIQDWLRVLRPGGYAYVAVSECENSLDRPRPVMPPNRLTANFEQVDRTNDIECGARTGTDPPQEEPANPEGELASGTHASHLHTISRNTFAALMDEVVRRFQAELIELHRTAAGGGMEHIAILRKL